MATRSAVWRFYAYRITVSNGFWLPVGVVYLQRVRNFGLDDVGLIMGGFAVAMVVAEVPTGYVGDRLGRRASLALGNLVLAGFMVGYTLVRTPLEYLALHVVWAFGWAFRSGTADAWLYELLAADGDAGEFARIRGRASFVQKGFEALTAALAGGLVLVDWSLPFLANGAVALLGIPLLVTARSADGARRAVDDPVDGEGSLGVEDALAILRDVLPRPDVRWLVAYATLFSTFYQFARDFEQPALEAVGVPVASLGLLYGGFKVVSGVAAATSGWFVDRFGVRRMLGILVPVYAVGFLGVAVAPVLVVPVLTANRSVMALLGPIRNQYLNDRLGDEGRATALSAISMAMLLAGGVAKVGGGIVAESVGLFATLAAGGVGVAAVGGLLWIAVSPVRTRSESGSARSSSGTASSD